MSMTHREALKEAVKKWLCEDDVDGFVTEAIDSGSVSWVLDAESALRAYIEARGLALVPREPTQAMLDEVTAADQSEPFSDMTMSDVYRAMLAAAPDPFAEGE